MTASEFTVPSSRGDVDLHCVEWPAEHPVATLQISHGMIEHIMRYADFAEFLNGHGVSVFGHDHLGHGKTSPDDHGTIAESDGDEHLVEDVYLVTQEVERRCPDVPHFILGHSMGSFVVRRYLTRYGDRVDGAIIVGTGNQSGLAVSFGKLVSSLLVKMKGPRYVSPFLNKTVLEGNDRKFDSPDLPNRWISRDEEVVRRYNEDPFTTFKFTASGYRDLFTLIGKVISGQDFDDIPKGLPIILLSGADDPVGESGKGVERARKGLEKAGLHPDMKLYEGGRHEILNETNRSEVYEDIWTWLSDRISQRSAPHGRRTAAGGSAIGAVMPLLRPHPLVPISLYDQPGPLEPGSGQRLPYRFRTVDMDPCHRHGAVASVLREPLETGLAEHPPESESAYVGAYGHGVDQSDPPSGGDPIPLGRIGQRELVRLIIRSELPADGEPARNAVHFRDETELSRIVEDVEEIPVGDVVDAQLLHPYGDEDFDIRLSQVPYLDSPSAERHSSSYSSWARSRYFPTGRSPRRMFMILTRLRFTTAYPKVPHILRI